METVLLCEFVSFAVPAIVAGVYALEQFFTQ